MSDIGATLDGTDIDFSDVLVSGERELRQAADSRLSNDVTMTNFDYGVDLANELGKTSGSETLGIRASATIMNDERFSDATLTRITRTTVDDTETIALAFDIVTAAGESFSLEVLVANGEVVLVP
jgi:hypothetical protein